MTAPASIAGALPVVLTIAGSDSGGGAGIQADLKTFAAFGCFGTSAITAVTAQNTTGVQGVKLLPAPFVAQQIESVFADFAVSAVKIGMLGNADIIHAVAQVLEARLGDVPLVLDPVMVATSGDALLDDGAAQALTSRLFPLAHLVTPNLPEAAALLDSSEANHLEAIEEQARALMRFGSAAVLLKGGHLPEGHDLVDVLADATGTRQFPTERVGSTAIHGTGCTLASAIAANLATGEDLATSIGAAQSFVRHGIVQTLAALETDVSNTLGHGATPIHHAIIKC